ncbi:MAG TPA: hypothetical protein VHH92_04910 [Actinomycetota bacterium]|nr:hypothetical protein [Actinomycetota bacterium]
MSARPDHGIHDQPSIGLLGLAVAERGLRLHTEDSSFEPERRQSLGFRVVTETNEPLTSYDVVHDRQMHLILVRRDLTGFQHLHPAMGPDGTWTTEVVLPTPGSWRAFADFSARGEPFTLGVDLAVPGEFRPEPLPSPTSEFRVDGHRVTLNAETHGSHAALRFRIDEDGAPVLLEPYLGARGHLVALREGDLAFLHVHPTEELEDAGRVSFGATLPSAGRFRLFLQYQAEGTVRTAAFTVER